MTREEFIQNVSILTKQFEDESGEIIGVHLHFDVFKDSENWHFWNGERFEITVGRFEMIRQED